MHGARGDDGVSDGSGRENCNRDVERAGEPGIARESFALVAPADVGHVAECGEPDLAISANGVRASRRHGEGQEKSGVCQHVGRTITPGAGHRRCVAWRLPDKAQVWRPKRAQRL